jgi:hypothetical protein
MRTRIKIPAPIFAEIFNSSEDMKYHFHRIITDDFEMPVNVGNEIFIFQGNKLEIAPLLSGNVITLNGNGMKVSKKQMEYLQDIMKWVADKGYMVEMSNFEIMMDK